jgi:hypothetical protein
MCAFELRAANGAGPAFQDMPPSCYPIMESVVTRHLLALYTVARPRVEQVSLLKKRSNEGPRACILVGKRRQQMNTKATVAVVCGIMTIFLLYVFAILAWG